jgi:ribosomal protein S18 acetylase RimI-like enzyme
MAIRVIMSDDPAWALDQARSFLASQPVLHNLILTLLRARIAHREPGRYWVALEDINVIGLLFQSPLDLAANVAVMGTAAVAAIVDAVADAGIVLPGVNGEAGTAARFAGQWAERCKSPAIPVRGERLYELAELRERPPVKGELRNAVSQDRNLVVGWLRGFEADAAVTVSEPESQVERWIPAQQVWIWDDGEPVSMAVSRECVEGVVRVAFVYTPPGKRGRGYAEACVSDLSRKIRDRGQRAILYTDLGNPTSNSIYRRIGYRAVAEGLRYRFE